MQRAKNKYHKGVGKEKAAKYYEGDKEVSRENARNKYRNLPEKKSSKKT